MNYCIYVHDKRDFLRNSDGRERSFYTVEAASEEITRQKFMKSISPCSNGAYVCHHPHRVVSAA